ncbi:uncharacterized protein LOC114310949 isoform X3 [Camellia sinensis]|uniref:uncharacterized protein LOC114310949 isoform X3 n=1 Tax=Camellia sinensis TaxID=4442 RepID=UPI001036CE93|nr:uncharacterized protein LOC114310949 isoform X3 [Camellia sinensis]
MVGIAKKRTKKLHGESTRCSLWSATTTCSGLCLHSPCTQLSYYCLPVASRGNFCPEMEPFWRKDSLIDKNEICLCLILVT